MTFSSSLFISTASQTVLSQAQVKQGDLIGTVVKWKTRPIPIFISN